MAPYTISDSVVKGRANHFTLMRLAAAYAVLFAHSYALSTGHAGRDPITKLIYSWWGQGAGSVAVVTFFVISGFLISASYLHRDNIFGFLEARILRIFPALFIAVLLCVFVVGAWVTSLSLDNYFSNRGTWSFVWNNITLLGGVQFKLPGVFLENPWAGGVNGSLWTLPIELYMYCMVMLVGLLGILKQRALFNLFAIVFCMALFVLQQEWLLIDGIPAKHASLMMAYIAGVFFYVNRAFIPLNMPTFLFVMVSLFLLHETVVWPVVQVFGFAYIVLFLALHPQVRLPNIDKWGDYSYGLYIYAFPVQQLVAKYITTSPIEMLFYSTLITFPLAVLSWKYVEKPALRLKGKIPMGRKWLDPRVREEPKA